MKLWQQKSIAVHFDLQVLKVGIVATWMYYSQGKGNI